MTDAVKKELPLTAILNWNGQDYELKYTFRMVLKLRAEGIEFPALMRALLLDNTGMVAADRGDEIAIVIAWLLTQAGCPNINAETVYRHILGNREFQKAAFGLMLWAWSHHTKQSENLPKPEALKPEELMTSKST